MADKKASLVLELKDLASQGIAKVSSAIGGLRTAVFAASAVFGGLVAILSKALDAYSEQESAVNRLNSALKTQGIESQALTNDWIKFSGEIQKSTTLSDEAVLSAMQMAVSMGISADRVKEATTNAIGLSKAFGIDLHSAIKMVSLAEQGEFAMLSRYVPQLRAATTEAEKLAIAQKVMADGFVIAKNETNTYAGRLAQLKNTWDELKETIGSFVVGPASAALKWLKDSVQMMTQAISGPEKVNGIYEKQITNLRSLIKEQEKHIQLMLTKKSIDGDDIGKEQERLATLEKSLAWYEQQNKVKEENDTKEVLSTSAKNEQLRLLDIKRKEDEKKNSEERSKNWISTLQFMAQSQNSHNKLLFIGGRAAAIAMATVDTFAAATKALTLGPVIGPIMAGIVKAMGFANIAQMGGVKLAEGGMVMPRSGGTSAIMGEAGKPEVAIPLDDERTKDKLRDTLGGGGTTIIIQAGAVIADDYSINQFVQKIDEKLFERQRNRRSYL